MSDRAITFNDYPGREFVLQNDEEVITFRILLVGERLYVMAVSQGTDSGQKDAIASRENRNIGFGDARWKGNRWKRLLNWEEPEPLLLLQSMHSESQTVENIETTCEVCGFESARIRYVPRSYGRGEMLLVVEDVPVVSCPHCGTSSLTAATMKRIDRIKRNRTTLSQVRSLSVATFS